MHGTSSVHEEVVLESDGRSTFLLELSKPTGFKMHGLVEHDFSGKNKEGWHVDNSDKTKVRNTRDDGYGRTGTFVADISEAYQLDDVYAQTYRGTRRVNVDIDGSIDESGSVHSDETYTFDQRKLFAEDWADEDITEAGYSISQHNSNDTYREEWRDHYDAQVSSTIPLNGAPPQFSGSDNGYTDYELASGTCTSATYTNDIGTYSDAPNCYQGTSTYREDWPSAVDEYLAMLEHEAEMEAADETTEEDDATGPCVTCSDDEDASDEAVPTGQSGPLGFFGLYAYYFSLDNFQLTLDGAGCVPVIGEPADALNAGISLCRGDLTQAGLSAISIVPVAGDAIGKGGKIGVFAFKKGDDIVGATAGAARHLDDVLEHTPTPILRKPGSKFNPDGTPKNALEQLDQLQEARDKGRAFVENLDKSKQAAQKYLDDIRDG